jgi:hypothetical protein
MKKENCHLFLISSIDPLIFKLLEKFLYPNVDEIACP